MNVPDQSTTSKNHHWKFFRYGGLDQVSIETTEDLLALDQLDPKLWAVLSCPITNIEFDARTLEFLDVDKDKRIKIAEVIGGLKWICALLKKPADLLKGEAALPLAAINEANPEGAGLLSSASHILSNLGKKDADSITVEDLADTQKIFAGTPFNGDGVVTENVSDDAAVMALVKDIAACVGTVEDRSGKPGVSEALLDKFLAAAASYIDWQKQARDNAATILFNGEETHAQAKCFAAVKAKIDDYFTRCQLFAFDANFAETGQLLDKEYLTLLKLNLAKSAPELRDFPLAMVSTDDSLPLTERTNPAWNSEMLDFNSQVVAKLVGDLKRLSEKDWSTIKAKFAPYEAWLARKAGSEVEKLGEARLQEIISSDFGTKLRGLIARDLALEPQFKAIESVEKLVRYYRYLHTLLNNFVVLKDFYSVKKRAVFQMGTLYMDSRSCVLCVKVDDIGKHSAMANSCFTYLVYCDCVRQASNEKMTIAAAFTEGDSDQLMPGRNGLFVDRKGNYWDATIVKIIDHPISVRQAFWSPYKRLGRFVNEQIEKFAAAKDKSVSDSLTTGVTEASARIETAPAAGSAPPPAPFDVGKFAGIFAAIGLALAAIGSALASVVAGFMSLTWWQMPLAIIGILLVISGPSMILAAMRLRQRNLGAILDASGWAVNTRAQINMSFGKTLTRMAELPGGSIRSLDDPFAEKKSNWRQYLILAIIALLLIGIVARPAYRNRIKNFLKRVTCCPIDAPDKKADKAAKKAIEADKDGKAAPAPAVPVPAPSPVPVAPAEPAAPAPGTN
ncbi:MAG: hypothetical protein CVV41_15095 [Candidatus Riflebacteria bacterium HGW-Riflebacteria-1]|jgi:hypothetical protein|nr:MAG: hypothetical protein CVV41_15095 [Candidatus Riflebacteria bacterium HGW-Riflebacteria-1]